MQESFRRLSRFLCILTGVFTILFEIGTIFNKLPGIPPFERSDWPQAILTLFLGGLVICAGVRKKEPLLGHLKPEGPPGLDANEWRNRENTDKM
jgi:hypothetical protein